MESIFDILYNWQPWQNFLGGKALLRGNLICYSSGTEGRRKLKFGEVGLWICQNFLRKNLAKKFSHLNALLS